MHRVTTKLRVEQPEALHSILIEELSDFGNVLHHDEKRLTLQVGIGIIDSVISGDSILVSIQSDTVANLHMLRESVNHYAEEHMGFRALTWSDEKDIEAGTLPPNCRVATVTGAYWFSNSFIRITLRAERLESYTHVGIHFRLGIPPKDKPPVWPHLSAKGKTIWPKGEDMLHTPAYTSVTVNPEVNELVFDVYAHNNGDTCAWAIGLIEGTDNRKEVLLSGPGGNWTPPSDNLIIAGDETALPAIRRTLETAKPTDNITAFIEMATPEDFVKATEHIDHFITRLARSEGLSAKQSLLNLTPEECKGRFIWFAGEKSDATELRQVATEQWKTPKDKKYIAGYWTRD